MAPLVSVIIPSYNGAAYLEQAVNSVIKQTYKRLECIIVDDGSTDHTHQLIQSLKKKDERIQYVYQENGGLGCARNKGIKESRGDWIQFLDADDWLNEDKISFQLDYFRKFASAADENVVLFSNYHVITVDSHQNILKERTQIFEDLSEDQLLPRLLSWNGKDDCPLHCNNVLLKNKVFDNDVFDETKIAFTDLEFFVRLLTRDVKFIYTPIVGMYFRRHPHRRTKNPIYVREAYVGYLELLYQKQKELLDYIPYIEKKMQVAFSIGDKGLFFRLLKICKPPVRLEVGSVKIMTRKFLIKTKRGLKFIFFLNLLKIKVVGYVRSKF